MLKTLLHFLIALLCCGLDTEYSYRYMLLPPEHCQAYVRLSNIKRDELLHILHLGAGVYPVTDYKTQEQCLLDVSDNDIKKQGLS